MKIRLVLSKLCRKFGFEAIKELMPEQDKKLVAHMQTTAERELKAKKLRLTGGGNGGGHASGGAGGRGGSSGNGEDGGVTKALRTFDAIMGELFGVFNRSHLVQVRCTFPRATSELVVQRHPDKVGV